MDNGKGMSYNESLKLIKRFLRFKVDVENQTRETGAWATGTGHSVPAPEVQQTSRASPVTEQGRPAMNQSAAGVGHTSMKRWLNEGNDSQP